MKKIILVSLFTSLACITNLANAEWVRITPYGTNIWPTGAYGIWAASGTFTNGCGVQGKQFLVIPGNYGVTTDGQKSFQAVIMLAMSMGKKVDINFYPADNCKVDSVTFVNE